MKINQKRMIIKVNISIVEIVTLSEKENYLKEKLNQMNVLDSKAKSTTDIIGFTLHKIQEEAIIKNKDKEHIHMQGVRIHLINQIEH